MQRRLFLHSTALAPALMPVLAHAANPSPSLQPQWPAPLPVREQLRRRYFPDIRMQTHLGQQVRLYEDLIKDRLVLINFIYLNCSDGTCPVTTYNLSQVQKLLKDRVGRDVFMYSVSIDPENDTVELLNRYAKSFHAGPGWLFLRASPQDTELLRKRLGFVDRDPAVDAKKSNHLAMVRLGNEPAHIWTTASAMSAPATIVKNLQLVDVPAPSRTRS